MTVHLAATAALTLLCLMRLPHLIARRRDAVFAFAAFAALASILDIAGVASALEAAMQWRGVAPLLGGLLMMAAFGMVRVAVVRAIVPAVAVPEQSQRALHLTCVAAAMYVASFVCMWLVAPGPPAQADDVLLVSVASESDIGAFVCGTVLNVFLSITAFSILQSCLRHVPAMASAAFRLGFWCIAVGCAFRISSQVVQEIRSVLIVLGLSELGAPGLDWVSLRSGGLSMLLLAVGLTLPATVRHLHRFGLHHRLHLLRLLLVWRRAIARYPQVMVHRRMTPARGLFAADPRAYLHRAVVELIDCDVLARQQLFSRREWKAVVEAETTLHA
jgi:hypothetical protein